MRNPIIAVLEAVLILPAALFMAALVVRGIPSLPLELAQRAQQFVMWYAGRMWTLWILLLALPFAALVIGSTTLLRSWQRDATVPQTAPRLFSAMRLSVASAFIAATTLAATAILVIVVLHMAAN